MQVITRNFGDRALSKHLRHAARFYARELMSKRLCDKLSLEIICKKNDAGFPESGVAEWTDQVPRPKSFRITIGKISSKHWSEYFKILAHEIVHVKQYARSEMTSLVTMMEGNMMSQSWHGSRYNLSSARKPKVNPARKKSLITELSGSDYYYHPWEVEAFGLEVGLFQYYREECADNPWVM